MEVICVLRKFWYIEITHCCFTDGLQMELNTSNASTISPTTNSVSHSDSHSDSHFKSKSTIPCTSDQY